jgi:hypothetical protein
VQDVSWLTAGLPNLIHNYRVPYDKFNHLDFHWAIEADVLVYANILEKITELTN